MNESERQARYFEFSSNLFPHVSLFDAAFRGGFLISPDLLRLVFPDVLHCYHLIDNSYQDQRVKLQEMRVNHVNEIFASKYKLIIDMF